MEQNTDLDLNIHGQDPMASSAGNNITSTSQNDRSLSSLSRGIKRKHSHLSEADESHSIDSKDLLHQVQKECKKKDKQLEVYSGYINMLKKSCTEKDTLIDQLKSESNLKDRRLSAFNEQSSLSAVNELQEECNNKNTQLIEMKRQVEQLKAEIAKKDTQLKAEIAHKDTQLETTRCNNEKQLSEKDHLIRKLQTEFPEMKKQLKENANTINNLQASCNDKDAQLEKKASIINNLQTHCNEKDAQLVEKECLIKRLQARHVNNENEMQVIPEKLKSLEDKVNSHFDTLTERAKECLKQKLYVKANEHYKEAIKFEQSTQERSEQLSMLFVNQSFCYGELKSHQQQIDAASSALQHDPNRKEALFNRAFGQFNLKQYSNARQNLEKALYLNPDFEFASKLLAEVQKRVNEAT